MHFLPMGREQRGPQLVCGQARAPSTGDESVHGRDGMESDGDDDDDHDGIRAVETF